MALRGAIHVCPIQYYQWNSSVRQEVYHLDAGENAMVYACMYIDLVDQ